MHKNKKMAFWKHYFFDNKIRTIFQNPNKVLSPYIKSGDSVVDYGCGTGFFAIPMKRIVAISGKVYAVDIEEKALQIIAKKANRGIESIVVSKPEILDSKELKNKIDFVLSSWSFHGIDDKINFLKKIEKVLKVGGKFLLIEPKMHMKKQDFDKEIEIISDVNFVKIAEPKIGLSYAALFEKRG